ncbi:TetR/AcrR family transcriptional regulator [Streptomyces sp. V4-01]|uniref:TetR/AcrR family transcriptional regulator n=1 Tax=Actinacidiphila polyblastidii TaxID=3110430 RepID=A0ABU7PGP4_9ACTN|nr:TetR/AcrR family transcriptional regulator [Streptomyces sp. V4-01]
MSSSPGARQPAGRAGGPVVASEAGPEAGSGATAATGSPSAVAEPRLTRKGQATRARIVAAASALVFERGVAGTSTDDVRAAAGVSTSQIYHYFADKSALVRAVIAHQTEAVLDAQRPLLGRLDSMEALRAWRDLVVGLQRERQCEGGCPIGSLAGELAEIDPEARAELAAGFARWEDGIRSGLRAMRDRGELRPGADPDRLSLAILAALQGGLLLTQTRRETAPLEAALDTMLAHVADCLEDGAAAPAG